MSRPTGRAAMRAVLGLASGCVAVLCSAGPASALGVGPAASPRPPVRHVFTIVLENESASTTFGSGSPAPYLSQTLRAQGAYIPNYYGIGHNSLDNYIAMISGQAPNVDTQEDCQQFVDVSPGTIGANGQANGLGCVYPTAVPTIAGQLSAAGLTWRSYNDGMGADPTRESAVCGHPAVGGKDNTQTATATDQYATRHNPFVYFHAIIDNPSLCDSHVVNLDALPKDLASAGATPNYVFITPNLCDDGHDATCANGGPGGLAQADAFLRTWVPRITSSPAFTEQDGLLVITFDEASTADPSACCGEIAGPGSPLPGLAGPGGGNTGAVMLSPCIAPGTETRQAYNHYTLLRSIEDIFGLAHLGYAGLSGASTLGPDVFTRACTPSPPVAHLHAPPIASTASARPRVKLRWGAADPSGAAGLVFTVQDRRTDGGGSHAWRTLLSGTPRTSARFAAAPARSYAFRVRAVNGAGQASGWAIASTVVPSSTSIRGGRFSGGWRVHRVRGAWEGHARVASGAGATLRLRYRGGALAIVGERSPSGGRVRITLDGRSRTIILHAGHRRTRQIVYRARIRRGRHTLRLRVLSGTVAIEGLAIEGRRR